MEYQKIYDAVRHKFMDAHDEALTRRFAHINRVIEMACRLNEQHRLGLDETKVRLAGLLHDYAKYVPDSELLDVIMHEYQGRLMDEIIRCPLIWHSFVCPYYLKHDLGITDPDIVDAVKYHTTGKIGMSPLTSLIFISDYIEEGRKHEASRIARQAAFEDLERAIVLILEFTIKYVEQTNSALFSGTEDIYRYYKERVNSKIGYVTEHRQGH